MTSDIAEKELKSAEFDKLVFQENGALISSTLQDEIQRGVNEFFNAEIRQKLLSQVEENYRSNKRQSLKILFASIFFIGYITLSVINKPVEIYVEPKIVGYILIAIIVITVLLVPISAIVELFGNKIIYRNVSEAVRKGSLRVKKYTVIERMTYNDIDDSTNRYYYLLNLGDFTLRVSSSIYDLALPGAEITAALVRITDEDVADFFYVIEVTEKQPHSY